MARAGKPGDLLEYTEERVIPTGTWHLDLERELAKLGGGLRQALQDRGVIVGYNGFLSRFESTAFTYTLTVRLRVHEINLPPVPEEQVQLASAQWWFVVGGAVTVATALSVGWAIRQAAGFVDEVGDLAETAPEAFGELSETVQTVAVALALIAFVYLLQKVLR